MSLIKQSYFLLTVLFIQIKIQIQTCEDGWVGWLVVVAIENIATSAPKAGLGRGLGLAMLKSSKVDDFKN